METTENPSRNIFNLCFPQSQSHKITKSQLFSMGGEREPFQEHLPYKKYRLQYSRFPQSEIALFLIMSLKSALDSILSRHFGKHYNNVMNNAAPGVQVVLVNGKAEIVYEGAIGLANPTVVQQDATTTSHQANLYSCSKFITACCILKLIENGKLRSDDRVIEFLPLELKEFIPKDVTIEQLIAHESGAPNPLPLAWVHFPNEHQETVTVANETKSLAAVLKKNPFQRGTLPRPYKYSNVGYWLLGFVVVAAFDNGNDDNEASSNTRTGNKRPTEFVKCCQELLDLPKSISDTFTPNTPMAFGHVPRWSALAAAAHLCCPSQLVSVPTHNNRWLRMEPHYLNGMAYGGFVASSRDMSVWLGKLLKGDVLSSAASMDKLFTPLDTASSTNSKNNKMTFGLHVRPRQGLRVYHKEGGGAGCHSSINLRPYHPSPLAGCLIAGDASFDVNTVLDELLDCVQEYQHELKSKQIMMETKSVVSSDGTRLHANHHHYVRPVQEDNVDGNGGGTSSNTDFLLKDNETVILLHGGPGVPGDYLQDLASLLIQSKIARSIVSFDQRGVGLSSSSSSQDGTTSTMTMNQLIHGRY
jgi:D-alanyl-D-alanine carboxypeptidase